MGKLRKKIIKIHSNIKSKNKIKISAAMKQDFINIPIPLANPTNPCLYSFLRGWKKVLKH